MFRCEFIQSFCFHFRIVQKVSLVQGQLSLEFVKMGMLEKIRQLRPQRRVIILFLLLQGKKIINKCFINKEDTSLDYI